MSSIEIFHTRIDNYCRADVRAKVVVFLAGDKAQQIATVNPEFLLEAKKNTAFRDVLNGCALNVADGVGITVAFWKRGERLLARYPGIDLLLDLLEMAEDRGVSIFLIAHKKGLSSWQKTADAVRQVYPKLVVHGHDVLPEDLHETQYFSDIVSNITETKAAIILCNFGAPEQELFLHRIKNATIDSVKIVMGVGGSFDYVTGAVPRAPQWMRHMGLEWLFRLCVQPHRLRRIVRATIIFPCKVLMTK